MAAQLRGGEVPQPKTFTATKDDVVSALSFYFGQPVSPEKLKDYNEHMAATYHFPDAFAGQNTCACLPSNARAQKRARRRMSLMALASRPQDPPRHDQQPRREVARNLAHHGGNRSRIPFASAASRLLCRPRSPRSASPAQIGLPFRRIEGTVRGPSSAPLAPPTAGLRSVD
jgi:hypothetical protein